MSKLRKQLLVLAVFLTVYALLAFLAVVLQMQGQPLPAGTSSPLSSLPAWVLGLANAAIILVVYGLLGLIGFWLARKLGLPGVFREDAGWRAWVLVPLALGLLLGLGITLGDRLFSLLGYPSGFPHPPFPLSLIASGTAAIGEEILFRGFVLALWAFLFNLILKRWGATSLALWLGNLIAALAFAAGHLPSAMYLLGVTSPGAIPPSLLAEMFLLNGLLGLVAGQQYTKTGLVAAMGVHFWADIVWHVVSPLVLPV